MTNDVDLIVFLKREHLPKLEAAFPPEEFYCPPLSVIQVEWAREQRGHFNLIHHQTGFKADIYTSGREALHHWALAHARRIELEGETITLAPPEYVIVRKLQFFREVSHQTSRATSAACSSAWGDWNRDALDTLSASRG